MTGGEVPPGRGDKVMRLKQLLGILLLASVSAMAADTVSQPGGVLVKNQDNAAAPRAGATTRIGKISVARGSDGLNIEISGSGPMTAKTMKLTHPDRVVVDIPNSVLQGRAREIPVNSGDVKSVRVGRYQEGTTRIVVDMAQMHDFQIAPEGNKLVVSMRDSSTSTPAPLPAVREVVVTADATPQIAAPQPVAPATTTTAKAQEKTVEATRSRSDVAASHFAGPAPALPSINQPPFATHASLAAEPAAINAALQQQQQAPATPAGTTVSVSAPAASNCTTGRYTGEPFGMNFKDLDLKDFF